MRCQWLVLSDMVPTLTLSPSALRFFEVVLYAARFDSECPHCSFSSFTSTFLPGIVSGKRYGAVESVGTVLQAGKHVEISMCSLLSWPRLINVHAMIFILSSRSKLQTCNFNSSKMAPWAVSSTLPPARSASVRGLALTAVRETFAQSNATTTGLTLAQT